jgi:hypothetical protein
MRSIPINILLGNADDPIESIQKYEEDFFRTSKLFRYENYLRNSHHHHLILFFEVMEYSKLRRLQHEI